MALTEFDRNLLLRCLGQKEGAWTEFVDRFLGLVVHVVNSTAGSRSASLTDADREDLCAEVFLTIIKNDFALLRHFRGQSSLSTYLAVIARRVVVRELLKRRVASFSESSSQDALENASSQDQAIEERISNQDEVQRLMQSLGDKEAEVVRMYHLEGKSYREISSVVGMPETTVGSTLTRAREKMRTLSEAT